jgi:hypothetical protein
VIPAVVIPQAAAVPNSVGRNQIFVIATLSQKIHGQTTAHQGMRSLPLLSDISATKFEYLFGDDGILRSYKASRGEEGYAQLQQFRELG